MTDRSNTPALALKKLGGLLLLIVGLLLLAAGIVSEVTALTVLGIVSFIVGAILLVLKIVMRNQPV